MKKNVSKNLTKVVHILSDGKYHDGAAIGKAMNISRSAVWKIIKKLKNYGVPLNSIKNKGYALNEPLVLLDASLIKDQLDFEIKNIHLFEQIESTNDYLRMNHKNKSMSICLAESQTNGKGRMERAWYSPFAENIYLSCCFPFQKDISELSGLSLVAGLAIAHTLRAIGMEDGLSVKWPNDVLMKDKKISGTLIELQGESHGKTQVIIGIGVNVNMMSDGHHIKTNWTSLRRETGKYIDRNFLCARLLNMLFRYLKKFEKMGLAPFMEEWVALDCLMKKKIAIKQADHVFQGVMKGINEQGHLLLKMTDGGVRAFASGEASVWQA